jgi:hypothetical protein
MPPGTPVSPRPAVPPAGWPATVGAYAGAPYPGYPPQPVRQPPPRPAGPGLPMPVRVDPVPGTAFGVAYLGVPPTYAGQAIGSLVAGIGSILVATIVACFGEAGARGGWGPVVAGAFAVLAALIGLGAVGLALFALREIRRSDGRLTGRGLAIAGIACGATGAVLTVVAMAAALLLR